VAALSIQADRLGRRAAGGAPGRHCADDEVERAKRRLRIEGDGLQLELELAWGPVALGTRRHPWRSLLFASAGGAFAARIDEASGGRLHRMLVRLLFGRLRTMLVRPGHRGL